MYVCKVCNACVISRLNRSDCIVHRAFNAFADAGCWMLHGAADEMRQSEAKANTSIDCNVCNPVKNYFDSAIVCWFLLFHFLFVDNGDAFWCFRLPLPHSGLRPIFQRFICTKPNCIYLFRIYSLIFCFTSTSSLRTHSHNEDMVENTEDRARVWKQQREY